MTTRPGHWREAGACPDPAWLDECSQVQPLTRRILPTIEGRDFRALGRVRPCRAVTEADVAERQHLDRAAVDKVERTDWFSCGAACNIARSGSDGSRCRWGQGDYRPSHRVKFFGRLPEVGVVCQTWLWGFALLPSPPVPRDTADVRSRRMATGWGGVGFVMLATATLVLATEPQLALAPAHAVAGILVGVGFATTAALLFNQDHQRGNARLFGLLTVVWLCGRLASHPVGALTWAAFLVSNQTEVVVAAALLRYPADRLQRSSKVFIVSSAIAAGVLQASTVLTSTPAELGLPDTTWPHLLQDRGWGPVTTEVRSVWLSAAAVVFLALLLRRWLRMAPLERRTLTPIVSTATFAGLATTPVFLNAVLSPQRQQTIYLIRSYAAVAVAAAFVVSAVQLALSRAALVTLVNRLQVPSSPGNIQSALREALLDRDLEVLFALPDGSGWVDDRGCSRGLPPPAANRMPILTQNAEGKPLALVVVDNRLDRYRTLLDAAVNLSRFALENARLEAGLRAQLLAVRQARARLLSASLEQRRQLERDLHDGAQQRLLAIGLRLAAVGASVEDDPATSAAIGLLRKELHVALDELRDLARGLYPAVLTQAGLGPALEAVIERLPVPIQLDIPPQRWHPDVESAAYLVACEGLTNAVHHAGDCTVRIDARQDSSGLRIRIADDGRGSDSLDQRGTLRSLSDRVTALGGDLTVTSSPNEGTVVEAVLPCE